MPLVEQTKGIVMTATERNRKRIEKNNAAGLKQFCVWLPTHQHAELKALVEMLKSNNSMTVVSVALQDGASGRIKGVKLR
jgi:hypothetical protein